jgi:putative ABC transport system substrate-binding protein
MQRREFITLVGGAVAAWPLAVRAQQRERMRRIGVLMNLTPDDAEGQARLAAFLQGLQEAGWAVGRNVRIDLRWGAGDADSFRKQAAELIALAPDVVFASGIPAATPLLQATRTVPIVFAQVVDPVGAGLVASLARPGGNATGFTSPEYGFAGKWVEVIKNIAPSATRVAVLRDAASSSGIGYLSAIQSVAASLGMELTPVGVSDADEIERGITAFARAPNGGLIVTGNTLTMVHRELIITLAARHRLPAVYGLRLFVNDGGLISYGPDFSAMRADDRFPPTAVDLLAHAE